MWSLRSCEEAKSLAVNRLAQDRRVDLHLLEPTGMNADTEMGNASIHGERTMGAVPRSAEPLSGIQKTRQATPSNASVHLRSCLRLPPEWASLDGDIPTRQCSL